MVLKMELRLILLFITMELATTITTTSTTTTTPIPSQRVDNLKRFLLTPDEQMTIDMKSESVLQSELKLEGSFRAIDVNISANGTSITQHSQFTFSTLFSIEKGRSHRINVVKIGVAIDFKNPPFQLLPALFELGFAVPKLPCEDECPCNVNYPYRTADGHCNNLVHSRWGMMSIPMRRWLSPAYDNGFSSPRQMAVSSSSLPSARLVSTTVHLHSDVSDQHDRFTHMLMQWGQFLDHDITSTPTQQIPQGPYSTSVACCESFFKPIGGISQSRLFARPQCFPIIIPSGDRHFEEGCMNFVRSVQVPNADCMAAPVEQLNQITAYIDASQVYGSSQEEQNSLRTFVHGKLKVTPGTGGVNTDHLPPEPEIPQTCPLNNTTDFCFFAGDRRVNENPTLQSMHTIFVRLHNNVVKGLKIRNCHWDDEKLFQEARKIIGAIMQVITYGEYLPIVLGPTEMNNFNLNIGTGSAYSNAYSQSTDASVRNAFATAAFRMGHSMIRSFLSSFDASYANLGSDRLSDVFGTTHPILSVPDRKVGHYARGLVEDCVQSVDCKLTEEVTDHLFPDMFGNSFDLAALNIQRGRDHGLPSYTKWRVFCDLSNVGSFGDLLTSTHTTENVAKLSAVYAHVDDIDLFSGGLTESPVTGGLVGPTFACLLGRQFKALKEGDRFWFEEENDNVKFTPEQVETIRKITLSHVLCFATDTESIQGNAFIKGTPIPCDDLETVNLDPWNQTLGEWTEWSDYGPCDEGVQTRSRTCEPCCGCKGPNVEARPCNSGPCGWSPWSYWSQCKADYRFRTRECRCPGCSTEADHCY